MSRRRDSRPIADVLRWNAVYVHVLCPYCKQPPRHRYNDSEDLKRLQPNCESGAFYDVSFPYDGESNLIAYEINKGRAQFTTIAARLITNINDTLGQSSIPSAKDDKEHETASFLSTLSIADSQSKLKVRGSLYKDSRDLVAKHFSAGDMFEQKAILYAIARCVNGDVAYIGRYLQSSCDREVF